MRIAICDDEVIFHQMLKKELEDYFNNRIEILLCDDFYSGSELLHSQNNYDLIFMDYQMDGLNGLDTVKQLRKQNNKAYVIFLTSFSEIVYDSFKVNTFRFLLKPINKKNLYDALDSFLIERNSTKYLIINQNADIIKIKINEIIYIQANNKSSIIRLKDQIIYQPKTLHELDKQLPPDQFYRSHKSYLISFKHIKRLDKLNIVFDNDEKALIGRNKISELKKRYISYLERYTFRGE